MKEALSIFDQLCFNLDLKESGMAEKVYKIIKETKAEDRTLVSSFSPSRLDEFIEVYAGPCLERHSCHGPDWGNYIKQDPRFMRPAEVDVLRGDSTKAKEQLLSLIHI